MPAPDSRSLVATWRVPALLTAMVLFIVIGGWWSTEQLFGDDEPQAPRCVPTPIEGGELRTDQVQVIVRNGGDKTGQARRVSGDLAELGFRIGKVGNTAAVERTVVVGASPDAPEVRLVRQALKKAEVRGDGRADHSVEVVIGQDFARVDAKAPRTIAVTEPSLCLPPGQHTT